MCKSFKEVEGNCLETGCKSLALNLFIITGHPKNLYCMPKIFMALIFFQLIICSCNQSAKNPGSTGNVIVMPDDAAIKKAVDDAYAAISFKEGEKPRYDSIQYFFIPQAQFINFIADTAQILPFNDFVKAFKNYIETGNIKFFQEEEIYGRTDQFGNIAQRISTYKTYANTMEIPSERGVNSFQLIKTKNGWRVSSIIWDVEDKNLSIPDYYLSK